MDIGMIFDWDGVVIDSSAAHEKSWELLAKEQGRTLPEGHFKKGFGRLNAYIFPEILGWTKNPDEIRNLSLRKEALYREVVEEQGIEALPGVRELLKSFKAANIPCAVGSSTERENIVTVMRLLGLSDFFEKIISADDVRVGKPDPEVFLKAAASIGRKPQACVVFEDSFAGLQAARAGGMKSVGVATTNSLSSLVGKADLVAYRLTDVDLPKLRRLFE